MRQTRGLLWLAAGLFLGGTMGVLAQPQGKDPVMLVNLRVIGGALLAGVPVAVGVWRKLDLSLVFHGQAMVTQIGELEKAVGQHGRDIAKMQGSLETLTGDIRSFMSDAPWKESKG